MDCKNTIHFIGNGGSAGTPSHSAGDWSKELSVATICHTDNASGMTAWANDTSYEDIFANQLNVYLKPGDLVLAYSGSGNSENVIQAIKFAKQNEGITLALTGYSGGKLKALADHNIHVNIDDMQIVEDIHMMLDHLMMRVLNKRLPK